jgi:hypothetical protein
LNNFFKNGLAIKGEDEGQEEMKIARSSSIEGTKIKSTLIAIS